MKRLYLFWIVFGLPFFCAQAQDSVYVLSEAEFVSVVLSNHPVASQSGLLTDMAAEEIRAARGNFDPKWSTSFNEKNFQNTPYWSVWSHELKVPVWTNTDLKVGYDKGVGNYLPDDLSNTSDGLLYAGISLPVLQGLLTDARRIALRQAQLMPELAEAERVKMTNKLLLESVKSYWSWSNAFRQLAVVQEGITLANFRFNAITQRVIQGDAAPIDSVEALIALQTRENDLKLWQAEFANAGLLLSTYLWTDEGVPLEINGTVVPETEVTIEQMDTMQLQELVSMALENHPELIKLNVKGQQLTLERRLNAEMLKPYLAVNYNFLTYPTNPSLSDHVFLQNNYKVGLDASFPLFLRKERAKLNMTKLKIISNDLDQSNAAQQIENEIGAVFNSLAATSSVLEVQRQIVDNYEILREGELQRFANGESSLFLVNTRENNLLDAKSKLIKSETEYQKLLYTLYWAAGTTRPLENTQQ